MIQQQNVKVLSTLGAAETASSGTATLTIDTSGFDHASVAVVRSSNAATTFMSVLKVEESDDNSSYANVTALVGGGAGGFTIGTAITTGASITKIDVDCRGRKRYLKVSATPSTACIVGINATLSRSEDAIAVATDAGVVSWVRG